MYMSIYIYNTTCTDLKLILNSRLPLWESFLLYLWFQVPPQDRWGLPSSESLWTSEDATDNLSWNVGKESPLQAA